LVRNVVCKEVALPVNFVVKSEGHAASAFRILH
jgi:hypothetical protein